MLSAFFAALTAIFAKIGVKDINSDLATAIRTLIILVITWGIVVFEHQGAGIRDVERHTWLFLILSGLPRACRGCSISRRCRRVTCHVWRR